MRLYVFQIFISIIDMDYDKGGRNKKGIIYGKGSNRVHQQLSIKACPDQLPNLNMKGKIEP